MNQVNIVDVINCLRELKSVLATYPDHYTGDTAIESNKQQLKRAIENYENILFQFGNQQSNHVPVYTSPQQPNPVGFGSNTVKQQYVESNQGMMNAAGIAAQYTSGFAGNTQEPEVNNTGGRYSNTKRADVVSQTYTPGSDATSSTVPETHITPNVTAENTKQNTGKVYTKDSEYDLVVPSDANVVEVTDENGFTEKIVQIPEGSKSENIAMFNRREKLESESQLNEISLKHDKVDVIPVTIKSELISKVEKDITDDDKVMLTESLSRFKEVKDNSEFEAICNKAEQVIPNFGNLLNSLVLDKISNTLRYNFDLGVSIKDVASGIWMLESNKEIFDKKHLKYKQPEFYVDMVRDGVCNIIGNLKFTAEKNCFRIIYEEPVIFLANDIISESEGNILCLRSDSFPKLYAHIGKAMSILDKTQTQLGIRIISYNDKSCKYNKLYDIYEINRCKDIRYNLVRVKQTQ